MRRLAAFLAAFLATLAVALVPLAASDLSRSGGQYAAEARQPGPTPPDVEAGSLVYEHIVYPGIQGERANGYLYVRTGMSESGDAKYENTGGGNGRPQVPPHPDPFAEGAQHPDSAVDEGRPRDRSVTLLLALDGILDNRDF